jgi:hypothetical protein
MNTRKTVYEKLFRNNETKLAAHEVELGLIQELESSSKANIDLAAKLDTEFTKFAEIRSIIRSDLSRLTTQNKDVSDRINKAITAAKELGVESPDLFKYNRYTQDINALIKDVTAKLNR